MADFGIGAIVSAHGPGTVAAGASASLMPTALRGSCTPLYASPQQQRGEPPDPRDDVYALGVIAYQMLSGELADRPGSDWREELAEAGASDGMLDVLGRCLAGRAERRWADAGELHAALERLGEEALRSSITVSTAKWPVEDEAACDSPFDLARQVQRSLERAQRALAEAVRLSEVRHDYAAAAQVLEGVPEGLRDEGLLDALRARRDRVRVLREEVREAAHRHRYSGLRDRVAELLELVPGDEELRRLYDAVPDEPGPELVNSLGMKLVLIPAGTFVMGAAAGEVGATRCEGPPHEVRITRPFYLGAHPVTQEQYRRVMADNPSHFREAPGQDTRLFPVETVSWEDAVRFCERLSQLPAERARRRVRYRLPTEAEWERACRAGGEPGLPFAHGRSLAGHQANFDGRSPYGGPRGECLRRTREVGHYEPNAFGLFDMHGQVWEWCQDWYAEGYYRRSPAVDPPGPAEGDAKVLRGGSWQNHGRLCRCASREWLPPGYRGVAVGLRVALEVGA